MNLLGVDPGPVESAWVLWNGERILAFGNADNYSLLERLQSPRNGFPCPVDEIAIEQIRGFGVMASDKLFDTCMWSGRFLQAFGESVTHWVPRKEVAKHLCQSFGSNDKYVREAIISRFGGEGAIGKKAQPGPLYGISSHLWAALAVALTCYDRRTAL